MKKILLSFLFIISYSISFSQVWGDNNSRTESRTNASLQGNAGAISGFFETFTPVNYPENVQNIWWHLLDVRHSNVANNYSLQLASKFGEQKLYFRELNNATNTTWSKVLLETSGNTKIDGSVSIGNVLSTPLNLGGLSLGNTLVDYTPTSTNYASSGSTILLNAKDYSTIGFNDISTRVDFIRAGKGIIQIGYNGGWGEASVGLPGTGIWKSNGYVGIGTTNPQEQLSVNGNIRAKQVKVEITNWPDYVFEKEYTLPSIESLQNYVQQNKHLPDVPSATEIEANGLNLGELNKVLIKKIEELTLYLLQQEKRINSLNDRLEHLTPKK